MARWTPRQLLAAGAVAGTLVLAAPLAVGAADRFTDVADDHVFHDDIAWLAGADVTRGCDPPANTRFCPGEPVTRGQMAAFMHRLAEAGVVDAATAETAVHAEDADTVSGLTPEDIVALVEAPGTPQTYTRSETFTWAGGPPLDELVRCDPGDVATGGGFETHDNGPTVVSSRPFADVPPTPNGWRVVAYSDATVYVVCSDLG